jgi:HK97 family phage major capsid protein
MNAELRKLFDKKGQIVKQMEDIGKPVKEGKQEKLTEEERTKLRNWNNDLVEIDKQIEDQEILSRASAALGVEEGNNITRTDEEKRGKEMRYADFKGMKDEEVGEYRNQVWNKSHEKGIDSLSEEERSVYNVIERDTKIFEKWMRNRRLSQDEQIYLEKRALSHVTNTAGEYLIPEGFAGKIIERMKFISQLQNWALIQNTATGNDIPFPTGDDTSNTGELLAENTEAAEQDETFGVKTAKAYVFSSKSMRVPNQLIQDNAVNLEAYIARTFANRIARIENSYFTTGTGSSQPEGYVTGATQGKVTASATAFTALELMELEHSLDVAYRTQKCAFAMHDNIILEIKELSVTTDPIKPIWLPSLAVGQPDRILGYRYFINNSMASSLTTGSKPIVFGDWESFMIRRVNGFTLQKLSELYAKYNQVAFIGFSRSDSRVLQPQGLKYLETT